MSQTSETGVKPGLLNCGNPACPFVNPQPVTNFHKHKGRRRGHQHECIECAKRRGTPERRREAVARHRERQKEGMLLRDTPIPLSKLCSRKDCEVGKLQPITAFGVDARARDGRESECRRCKSKRSKRHYDSRGSVTADVAFKICSNPQCPEQNPQPAGRFGVYKKSKDGLNWQCKTCKGAYYKRDKRRYLAAAKRRYAENPKVWLAYGAARRARRRNAQGRYAYADVLSKLQLQGGKCYYCIEVLTEYHIDHKIALVNGGSNWPANICIACPSCNLAKKARDFWEFLAASKRPSAR